MLLDITLTNGWAIGLSIVVVLILFGLYSNNQELEKQKINLSIKTKEYEKQQEFDKNEYQSRIKEQLLEFQKKEAELRVTFQNWAIEQFEKYKQTEIQKIQKNSEEAALRAATVVLQKWKIESEAKIRQDAINRSYAVNLGKITEHLVPFHQAFLSQFNPKDARFIGSPIDLIVFDGYSDKRDEIIIYFVEIKSGNSKLTETQKKIKESVKNAQVRWAEINPDNSNVIEIADNNINNTEEQLNLFKG